MKKIKKRLAVSLIIILSLATISFIAVYRAIPTTFVETRYRIEHPKITSPIRIVQLSDVHNKEYGEGNIELLNAVEKAAPDLIFVTGDLVDRESQDITPAMHLIEELTDIAPVYFSYGNHEWMNEERYGSDIGAQVEAAGGIVMDYVYQDVDIQGQSLRIGGIYGYCLPDKYLATNEANAEECRYLNEFQQTERTTVLLTHMPYAWLELDGLNEWEVDIIFAGHSHGGQIELPLFGPVYAPDQGWFPDRVAGKFQSEDGNSTLIVSRGLGDSVKIPRVNNPWEIVGVEIQ